jgi:phytoene desaturase
LVCRERPAEHVTDDNIHFGAAWGDAFDALLNKARLMPEPSRLVTVPSLDDATLAARGFPPYMSSYPT